MNELIGRCEICGLVDHHLLEGLCPVCAGKCSNVPDAEAPGESLPNPREPSRANP